LVVSNNNKATNDATIFKARIATTLKVKFHKSQNRSSEMIERIAIAKIN
jgi:hypothetical protein